MIGFFYLNNNPMKKIILSFALILMLLSTACDDLLNLVDPDELTTEQVTEGLKTALEVGTDSTVSIVSALNGYYQDEFIKIPLPAEARVITDNLDNQLFQGLGLTSILEQGVEDVILSINRAAEDAASDAAPIFKKSITDMSISDAWAILNGSNPAETRKAASEFDSTAATAYLKSTTYSSLVDLYAPVINLALDKDVGAGFSANDAWETLTGTYNPIAESLPGSIAGLQPVNTELDEFVVGKALDGLFYKVGLIERKIRRDPLAWASSTVGKIFEKVFGG